MSTSVTTSTNGNRTISTPVLLKELFPNSLRRTRSGFPVACRTAVRPHAADTVDTDKAAARPSGHATEAPGSSMKAQWTAVDTGRVDDAEMQFEELSGEIVEPRVVDVPEEPTQAERRT